MTQPTGPNPYAPPEAPMAAYAPVGMAAGPCCHACQRRAPTMRLTFMQNIGLLIMRFSKHVSGEICRACADEMFWKMTLTTFFLGWWGVISFFYSLVTIPVNVTSFVRSRSLPRG